MSLMVKSPGSCGELVQGMINGENFLITCPVNLYSQATAHSVATQTNLLPPKASAAVAKSLAYLRLPESSLTVALQSAIPAGKGMASSSADISAVCQAVALEAGYRLTSDEIADIALSIEPTDGTFYKGIVMFDHVTGRIREYLGEPPPMFIAVFDLGGEIDTLAFNRRNDLALLNKTKEQDVLQAVDLVRRGLTEGNPYLIGQGATLSALANQPLLFKPHLEQIINIADTFGAAGISAAHSGTVIGVLFPAKGEHDISRCIAAINVACPGVRYFTTLSLISGGLVIEEEKSNECSSS